MNFQKLLENYKEDESDESFDPDAEGLDLNEDTNTFTFRADEDFSSDEEFAQTQKRIETAALASDSSTPVAVLPTNEKLSKYKKEKILNQKKTFFEGLEFDQLKKEFEPKLPKKQMVAKMRANEKTNKALLTQYLYLEEAQKKKRQKETRKEPFTPTRIVCTKEGNFLLFSDNEQTV